jgi:multimeric flavodoxin WrbA
MRIVGIAGSLRSGSFNAALLRAAVEECPSGAMLEIESIRGIPLYDGDVEAAQGIPARAAELKERVALADALLLVTPEYNNSIPVQERHRLDDAAALGRAAHLPGRTVGFIGAAVCAPGSDSCFTSAARRRCSTLRASSSTTPSAPACANTCKASSSSLEFGVRARIGFRVRKNEFGL